MTGAALHLREQIQQTADGGGLGRPARADQQDATQIGIYQSQQERQFHLALPDDGQEGERQRFGQSAVFLWQFAQRLS